MKRKDCSVEYCIRGWGNRDSELSKESSSTQEVHSFRQHQTPERQNVGSVRRRLRFHEERFDRSEGSI